MPGRGPQTFKKRQKEQQRKERQEEKMAKRLARKQQGPETQSEDDLDLAAGPPNYNDEETKADTDPRLEMADVRADRALG
jgi:hypothetical protein